MSLSQFRIDDDPAVPPDRRAGLTTTDDLVMRFEGRILSFDQTISNTGYAVLVVRFGNGYPDLHVRQTGMLTTDPVAKGHEDSLVRADLLFEMITRVVDMVQPDRIVHETPPVSRPGTKMSRPESSLLAALAVRVAASMAGIPVVMVGAQKAKKLLTGNGNADKSLVKEAIRGLLPEVVDLKPCNEHTYDAIALGVVAAEEE